MHPRQAAFLRSARAGPSAQVGWRQVKFSLKPFEKGLRGVEQSSTTLTLRRSRKKTRDIVIPGAACKQWPGRITGMKKGHPSFWLGCPFVICVKRPERKPIALAGACNFRSWIFCTAAPQGQGRETLSRALQPLKRLAKLLLACGATIPPPAAAPTGRWTPKSPLG